MDSQISHRDEATRHRIDEPYTTPMLRELGSLKEMTMAEISGNNADGGGGGMLRFVA